MSSADADPTKTSSLIMLERFRTGDSSAADALFERYFERLTLLARARLSQRLASRVDPEEVALSAYRSFFAGARDGRFVLSRGGDLWRLLAAIARHKLLHRVRHETADRRSIDLEQPLDSLTEPAETYAPAPEDAAALADELEWILARISPLARRVLELRLQGLQYSAIAEATGRSERTIRRTLNEVRAILSERLDHA